MVEGVRTRYYRQFSIGVKLGSQRLLGGRQRHSSIPRGTSLSAGYAATANFGTRAESAFRKP